MSSYLIVLVCSVRDLALVVIVFRIMSPQMDLRRERPVLVNLPMRVVLTSLD